MLERLGFIGTGSITEAIIDGLAQSDYPPAEVIVSPRNADVAARLARRHAMVRVAPDNQHVLDHCPVVCLAVRPQIAEDVIRELRFSARHHVLSFIATFRLQRLQALLPDVARVIRLAPLPMVAHKLGTTIIHPRDPIAAALFNTLGTALESDDEDDFDVLFAATALMGSFFQTLHAQGAWLREHGISQSVSRAFLASLVTGLSDAASRTDIPFDALAREFSTRGGLNEQITEDLAAHGVFGAHAGAMERVLERIRKPAVSGT
ncbi:MULTISPECIES: pyrroline-5-carboxylate reductase [unclassified Achromobacter]|uniref:pyrroline-5-carboxylate reductase n=1 Tax=unclassified Achromobacter TaxID=2626865 RepID=UPI000B51B09B|nr:MULTISPECIES: pyrroline-5-carboxylate reductase [unclassified Achromobacter]OWT75036.1 pyrroline-5-carboxylate reductase [Achromobacter sp. HZ28]OWT76645.1 pyrroline-5-carboxylate reductase [Achromobacter sp. HZ34]